jgi:(E)-4-hydroxy-3-methylbut-2-enyl-diphosphate synthase
VGRQLPESPTEGIQYIIDADLWEGQANTWPAFKGEQLPFISGCSASLKFLFITYMGLNDEVIAGLKYHPEVVLVAQSNHPNRQGEYRALAHQLMNEGLKNPLVFFQHYAETEAENLQIKSAADMGALIIDGLCDGIFLFGDILFDTLLFLIQADFTPSCTYISVIGIGHFTGTVDYATHDSDFESFQV